MDRRGFCKTVLMAPLLMPLIGSQNKKGINLELQLISSSPQRLFVPLLKEIQNIFPLSETSFVVLNSFPHKQKFVTSLIKNGWRSIQNPNKAALVIYFHRLLQPTTPSFTLVKNNKVWDIRTKKLFLLWKEMNDNHPRSSWLTVASFNRKNNAIRHGSSVTVYIDGKIADKVSLKKAYLKSYATRRGTIEVQVEQGRARVVNACCANKICLHTPPVSLEGERIICAPSHFLLEVDSHGFVDTVIG